MINVTNHPLISIVIPVYNGEKTLVETLKSVLNQMYSHFEIIIVDNGSDQPVETLIQSFLEDKRIRVLRTNGKKFIPYFRKERYGTRNVLIINCIYRFVIHRTISGSGLINWGMFSIYWEPKQNFNRMECTGTGRYCYWRYFASL